LGFGVAMMWRVMASSSTAVTSELPQVIGEFDITLPVSTQNSSYHYIGNWVKESSIVVIIHNDDEIYIGRDKVTLTEIPEKMKSMLRNRASDEVVYIVGTDSVSYRTLVSVVDRIREACGNRIGLRLRRKQPKILRN